MSSPCTGILSLIRFNTWLECQRLSISISAKWPKSQLAGKLDGGAAFQREQVMTLTIMMMMMMMIYSSQERIREEGEGMCGTVLGRLWRVRGRSLSGRGWSRDPNLASHLSTKTSASPSTFQKFWVNPWLIWYCANISSSLYIQFFDIFHKTNKLLKRRVNINI